jgi:serine phosphatase RsbU (regulator of sigma subunit)
LLSVVLTDSSSYGLSSALTSALMRVAARLSTEDSRSCSETVRRIQADLQATLADKDRFSMFYGVVSRKDYRLRYVHFGDSVVAYAAPGESSFRILSAQGPTLRKSTPDAPAALEECVLPLQPGGRLVLLSDGFVEASGGTPAQALALLSKFRDREAKDSLNELVYRVKSVFQAADDMPAQDCTAVVLDVDARVIRLA